MKYSKKKIFIIFLFIINILWFVNQIRISNDINNKGIYLIFIIACLYGIYLIIVKRKNKDLDLIIYIINYCINLMA